MSVEKLRVLEMIEKGTITAKEGMELLNAIEQSAPVNTGAKKEAAKWIRIRVYDPKEDAKVKVNLPISILNAGIKIGSQYSEEMRRHIESINMDEILELIKNGAEGNLVDVEKDDGTKVEIFVE